MYNLAQIAEICNCRAAGNTSLQVNHFFSDSREPVWHNKSLFIALTTSRNNGHRYIPELIKKGVTSFLIQEGEWQVDETIHKNCGFLISKDPLLTLQNLAAYHRQQFSIPVIGITGSNGKTMVKEWLYQLLKPEYSICRSPKSYNSQIGVPLSVLNLRDTHTLAIFEAGISQPGEMDRLASIIRPTLAVLTSLGSAHDEGFENSQQKLQQKARLLQGSGMAIINGIHKHELPWAHPSLFVSPYDDADVHYIRKEQTLILRAHNQEEIYSIPFTDAASLANLATCICVMKELGYSYETIAGRLKQLQPLALRLELKKGILQSLLINDYYNSDLDSLQIALGYLSQKSSGRKKMVIVSDIEQSGMAPERLYTRVGELLLSNQVEQVIGIGRNISTFRDLFGEKAMFFDHTDAFLQQFKSLQQLFAGNAILLKGARSFGFERISRLLEQKSHDTVFEVNLNKLTDNVNYYRGLVKPSTKLMCMVKAMGYGSGSVEVAQTLQHMGVGYLAVAYADEGVELRSADIRLPIMVMSPEVDAFEDMISHRLEPEIYSFRILNLFVKQLDAMGVSEPFPVHIKVDTGMHRLGFQEQELMTLLQTLKVLPQITVVSVFSHLAASDNPTLDDFSTTQIKLFTKACELLENGLGYSFLKHICNSGGISRFPSAHFDMVRLGIGMYGLGVNAGEQTKLSNVGALKTRISQIKKVTPGSTIGYNRNGKVLSETTIAVLPIGYADGYSRMLGNGQHGVYIHGQFCKTIGNICMDMCMVDVSEVNCKEGDEAVIFDTHIQINQMAEAMRSIPYEVLTSVSGRVKRVYVQE